MVINEDFKFRDDKKADTVPIELLTGPFKGVLYRYTQVRLLENENDTATVQFEYDILDSGELTETKLRASEKFSQHIGIILNSLILESIDAAQEEIVNENREGDPQEPVEE